MKEAIMDRYHPDPYYQSLIDQARIERNTHLHSVLCERS
jgi:hypothetical protein